MTKALVILSTLLNLAFIGALGGARYLRPDDTQHVVDYFQMEQPKRETLRNPELIALLERAQEDGAKAPEEYLALLQQYTKNKAEREAFDALLGEAPDVAVQRLITDAASSQRTALAQERNEHEISVERMRMLLGEFADFQERMKSKEEALTNKLKDFEARRDQLEKMHNDSDLKRIITQINEEKKAEDAIGLLSGRPVAEIHYIISQLEEPTKQTAIFNELSAEDQAAINKYKTKLTSENAEIEAGRGANAGE